MPRIAHVQDRGAVRRVHVTHVGPPAVDHHLAAARNVGGPDQPEAPAHAFSRRRRAALPPSTFASSAFARPTRRMASRCRVTGSGTGGQSLPKTTWSTPKVSTAARIAGGWKHMVS